MSTVTSGAAGPPPAERTAGFRRQRLNSLLNYARYTDPAVLVLWVFVTTFDLPFLTPFRYAAAGYFAGMSLVLGRQFAPAIGRAWPLFLLPLLCTMSSMWALVPEEALRKGIALAMTAIVAIYVSTRLSGPQILIAYFSIEAVVALLSLVAGARDGSGAWMGIYNQKNFFAIQMFILYGSAIGIAFDRNQAGWLRGMTLVFAALAAFLVLMAKSGTTTLMLLVITTLILGHAILWGPLSRVRHARTLIALFFAVIGLAVSFILFGVLQIDVKEEILTALGKDPTLTGRTYLWEIAKRLIDQHPLTGLGSGSFWRPELGEANAIVRYFAFDKFTSFSFHNSYYENGVAYGYPGFFATIFVACWVLFKAGRTWLLNQTVINATFLMLAIAVVIRSNSEVDLASEFAGTVVLMYVAATRNEKREKPAAVQGPSAPSPLPQPRRTPPV